MKQFKFTKIKFSATKKEQEIIIKIVSRVRSFPRINRIDPLRLTMDIEAVHCNGTPLDLDRLLEFPDFDFIHDITGIIRHIDRSTGKLKDYFLPRCAR